MRNGLGIPNTQNFNDLLGESFVSLLSMRLVQRGAPFHIFAERAHLNSSLFPRRLATIDAYGEVSYAEDITIDELKRVVDEIIKVLK